MNNSYHKGLVKLDLIDVTPYNYLSLAVVPRFTQVPPSVKTVRVGGKIHLVCMAVSDKGLAVQLTWIRVSRPLPVGRSKVNGGQITINNIQRDDYGEYACLASTKEGVAKHSTTITVLCEYKIMFVV
jgi:hypothetical protein